ncbi:hypothetical protein E3P84_02539 [Wallemia ichthyophaga]|uniref:Uncharacterized protein n=1 Tax=Wallemia ichthyophaga TaxID=245174 RepID=A0A4T0JEL0_WALIC|nr:hypothetical protein E3P84_02539 [Wallemia ichthyophaga]TIB39129.1 hypothetical protein E3P86_01270 [Wallemia ichthyophaga]TIB41008.1 hypothetical protein E3P83_02427 [Wallemia ichthyophaga]
MVVWLLLNHHHLSIIVYLTINQSNDFIKFKYFKYFKYLPQVRFIPFAVPPLTIHSDGNLSSAVSMGHQQGQDAQNQAKTQSQTKCLIDGTITHSYSPCSSWQPWDAGPKYRF